MMTRNRKLYPPLAKPGTPSVRIFLPPVPAPVLPWYEVSVPCENLPVPAGAIPAPAGPPSTVPAPRQVSPPALVLTPVPLNVGQWARAQYSNGACPRGIAVILNRMVPCPPPPAGTRWTIGSVIALLMATPSKGRRRSWKRAPVQPQ